jgi:preprotein translocase subunit SecE
MAAQAETRESLFDNVKLLLAIVLLIAGIAGFYYFAAQPLVIRVVGLLVVAAIVVGLISMTAIGKQALGFMRESRAEVRKVIWPTRQETMQATMLVVALVFIVGLVLWLLDMFLFWGVGLLTGQKV